MENAVDALKLGFAVFVFGIALSLAMFMFAKARSTADIVLHSSDQLAYMEFIEATGNTENRVVGLETIIPTLYKYYKENYTVIFRRSNGQFLELYTTQTRSETPEGVKLWSEGYTNQYYGGYNKTICSFDITEETQRHEPWTGDDAKNKEMLDHFISGTVYKYTDSRGEQQINFGGGLYQYKDRQFIESVGEYEYDADNENASTNVQDYNAGLIKSKKKRVIIYTLQ